MKRKMASLASGASELIAIRARATSTGQMTKFTPYSVLIRTGLTGTTTAALDLNSATEAGAPVQRTATITNAGNCDYFLVLATIVTPDNGWAPEGSVLGHLETETEAGLSAYRTVLVIVSGSIAAPSAGVDGDLGE